MSPPRGSAQQRPRTQVDPASEAQGSSMAQEEYRDPAEKATNHSLDQELEQKPKGKTSRVEEEKPEAQPYIP